MKWKTRRVSVGSVLEHSVARKAKQELHVALIGAGRIARGEHLLAWRNFSGTRVVAIADPSPEALETIGRQFSIVRRVGDYRELLDDQQIDVIDICAPSALHADADVLIVLASPDPLPRSYADDLIKIVRDEMDDNKSVVEVHCVQTAWIESESTDSLDKPAAPSERDSDNE